MSRGRLTLLAGVLCSLSGLGVMCGHPGPVVIPSPAPRDPITSLDAMEPGQSEVSASMEAPVVAPAGGYPGYQGGISPYAMQRYWTVSAQQAVGGIELRVMLGHHLGGPMADYGVGYRLPSAGRWDLVVDAGLSTHRIESAFEVPYALETVDTAAGELFPEQREYTGDPSLDERTVGVHGYGYRVFAPHLRGRAVFQAGEHISVPLALRLTQSWTAQEHGLFAWEEQRQTYVELTAGALWTPDSTCFQLGAGAMVNLTQPRSVVLQAALSCRVVWDFR